MLATLERMAGLSRASMDGALTGRAAVAVSVASESGLLLGAFQRGCDGASARFRRASGGSALTITPGTVHVVLALASPDALTPCDENKVLNRHVRPLLRATGARYFGRDWASVDHRPAAFVGVAHDATSKRTAFEAFVAVRSPLWTHARPSFLDKEPTSLGPQADPDAVARSILEAYRRAYGALDDLVPLDASPVEDAPPWTAREAVAIGEVCAGRDAAGVMRLGGELMASRDAVAELELRLASEPLENAIDETLGRPGVLVFGVKSLASIRDVIQRAIG